MKVQPLSASKILLIAAVLLITARIQAQEPEAGSVGIDYETYLQELAKRDQLINALHVRLEEMQRRINKLEEASANRLEEIRTNNQVGLAAIDSDSIQNENRSVRSDAIPSDQLAAEGDTAAQTLSTDRNTEQNRLIRNAFENTLIDRGGLLLPPGTYNFEPSLTYIHSSSENINIDGFTIFPVLVVGDIVSERLIRDVNILNLTLRAGLPWDSQAEIRIPVGHQKLRSSSADGEEREFNDNGLGDIELTFAHQLYRGVGKWPDLVANLRWKSRTGADPFTAAEGDIFVGSGYSSTQLSINAVKVIDPVVYFAGIGYTYNATTNQEIGKFDPGDSWGFNLGMAIALNLNNSLSFAYDQQFTRKSRLDGITIPGSFASTGVFSIGSSFLITDSLTIDFSVGVGVTEDSPDLLLSTSFPLRGNF